MIEVRIYNTTKKEVTENMSEEKRQLKAKVAALLHQTAEDHHVAYKETDGVDPNPALPVPVRPKRLEDVPT